MSELYDPRRTALLSMDFQRDIALEGGAMAPTDPEVLGRFSAALDAAAEALQVARTAGLSVIHVRVALRPEFAAANPHTAIFRAMQTRGALIDGSPGAEIVEQVAPIAGEVVITKRMVSSFVGTDLGLILTRRGIDTLILAGLVTHYVVEGTARHAADLGYRVVVLEDACASGGMARHRASLELLRTLGAVTDVAGFRRELAS